MQIHPILGFTPKLALLVNSSMLTKEHVQLCSWPNAQGKATYLILGYCSVWIENSSIVSTTEVSILNMQFESVTNAVYVMWMQHVWKTFKSKFYVLLVASRAREKLVQLKCHNRPMLKSWGVLVPPQMEDNPKLE